MNRLRTLLLLPLLVTSPVASPAEDEASLISLMVDMQYFSHKLQLSIDHGNARLANFYAHELEEVIEATMEVADYHGSPIGTLTGAMLLPAFEQLETAIADNLTGATQQFDALINACNACHQASNHGYIVVRRNPLNPYLQDFGVTE